MNNDLVNKLVEQCWVYQNELVQHEDQPVQVRTTQFLDPTKLAYLVVQECIKVLNSNAEYNDAADDWTHPESEDLLKHFGIELLNEEDECE